MDILSQSGPRPWPVPLQPWIMEQKWHNLLFAHWPLSPEAILPLVPKPLQLDICDGQAWVGIVAFRLSGIRLRCLPALPFVSSFNEINVRTYVTLGGKPGVLFLSMDADNISGTAIARPTFRVPYTYANIALTSTNDGYAFHCARHNRESLDAAFEGIYRPISRPFRARQGSLEQWLTERYCYYSVTKGKAYRCEIAHGSWPLCRAQASIAENTMATVLDIDLPDTPPLLHYAHRMDALFWWPRRVTSFEF